MLEIDARLSDAYLNDAIDYSTAEIVEIRYTLFLGSIFFKNKDSFICLDWDWIPLVDFSLELFSISLELLGKNECTKQFDFTESDDLLLFQKENDLITIKTSYSEEMITVPFVEFVKAARNFHANLIADIRSSYDTINQNNIFEAYRYLVA